MIRKYSLLGAAFFMAAGILLSPHIGLGIFWTLGALCALFLLFVCAYRLGHLKSAAALAAVFAICCGMARADIFESEWQALSHHVIGAKGIYTVSVTEPPLVQKEKGYVRYTADLESIRYDDGTVKKLSGAVYLYGGIHQMYPAGSKLSVSGNVSAPLVFDNPGKIYMAGRYKSMHLIGRIYADDGSIRYEGEEPSLFITRLSNSIHSSLKQLASSYMDPVRASILMTLLFGGNYQDIPQSVMDSFSVTGIIHILSVSGSHVALLFGFLCLFGKWLFLPKRLTLILSVLLVLFYATLSGWVPPVVRASVMGVLAMGGLFLDRQRTSLNILGAAIFGMLLYDPMYVYDVSFQLSALASAGILLFYRPLSNFLAKWDWIPMYIREGCALCLAAQLLTVPVVLHDFHRLPLYSVFANLLVTPLLEWAIIVGLFASLISLAILPLAGAVLSVTDGLLWAGLRINFFLSRLPYASLMIGGLGIIRSVLWYVFLFSVFCWKEIAARRKFLYPLFCLWAVLLCILSYQMIRAPKMIVYVPQLGLARGAVLVTDAAQIVYYKNNGILAAQSARDMESFTEYLGLSPLIFIDDRENAAGDALAPNISAAHRIQSGGNTLQTWTAGDVAISTNGSSWSIEQGKAAVYMSGARPFIPEGLRGKDILFIGGSGRFTGGVSEKLLQRIAPSCAVYAGGNHPDSGEDLDRFHERDIDVYDVNREGLIAMAFTNRWNKESWQWLE